MSTKETKDGSLITIFVKPNQPKFKITIDGDEVVVCSAEAPEKGKVNMEILKEFTRLFHTQVELVGGAASRQKQLLVKGLSKCQVEQLLKSQR